jgi:hypothetical protein
MKSPHIILGNKFNVITLRNQFRDLTLKVLPEKWKLFIGRFHLIGIWIGILFIAYSAFAFLSSLLIIIIKPSTLPVFFQYVLLSMIASLTFGLFGFFIFYIMTTFVNKYEKNNKIEK